MAVNGEHYLNQVFGEPGTHELTVAEHGTTFIFSTHDPRVMERARRLVTLVDGRVERDERRTGAEA